MLADLIACCLIIVGLLARYLTWALLVFTSCCGLGLGFCEFILFDILMCNFGWVVGTEGLVSSEGLV